MGALPQQQIQLMDLGLDCCALPLPQIQLKDLGLDWPPQQIQLKDRMRPPALNCALRKHRQTDLAHQREELSLPPFF
jgi:hypothetical protein